MALTPRQTFLLRKLVEAYRELDQPIGSKWIAEQDDVPWGPSTVRAELAKLEEGGLLEHPHTSAGRVPTETGLRLDHMVRFTKGSNLWIGFHGIPVGRKGPIQKVTHLGMPLSHGCVRQAPADAQALWDFAPLATKVVVTK